MVQKFSLWWNRYSTHVYGIVGLIGVVVPLILLFTQKTEMSISKYFSDIEVLDDMKFGVPISSLRTKTVILKNQGEYNTNVWDDSYDFKLITGTSIESTCKGSIETISLVKKQLSDFLSIESYAIFGDSIKSGDEMNKFLQTYNFSVKGLYGQQSEIESISNQLHLHIKNFGTKGYSHSTIIILLHRENAYLLDGSKITARELVYSILERFQKDKIKTYAKGKTELKESSIEEIANGIKFSEKNRQFDIDCSARMGIAFMTEIRPTSYWQ